MIKRFRSKALKEAFAGRYGKLDSAVIRRVSNVLDALDAAQSIEDIRGLPGFHSLTGNRQGDYSIVITGNYRITFTIESDSELNPNTGEEEELFHITDVKYEDYH